MSLKEMERFDKTVKNDPEMLNELKNMGTDVESVVRFANRKGFDFTVDDIKNVQAGSGDLSDEELDQVSGGVIGIALLQMVTVAGFIIIVG